MFPTSGIAPLMRQDMGQLLDAAAGPGGLNPGKTDDPRRGAKEIEGYFIGYLMKLMRQSVPKGLFGQSAGDQFQFFYDQEIGRLAADSGGFGLTAMIEEDLKNKGFVATDTNRLSSGATLPIQGPRETADPAGSVGPQPEKG